MTTLENPAAALPAPAGDDNAAVMRVQSRVDAAAFALLREGKNPTVALVRDRMGGGSPNLVAPALQKWRFTLAAQLDANAGSALEILPPGVLELVQALWSRALFEAHRVQADTATSTADAVEQLHATIMALRDQAARLQQREAAVDGQLRELDERLSRVAATEAAIARRTERKPAPRKSARSVRPSTKRRAPKKRQIRHVTGRKSAKVKRR